MEARIEGGIHKIRLLWQQHAHEEGWGFLLIGRQIFFNEENWTEMMWDVRYECPSGAQFTFNCSCHWATMVVHNMGGSDEFFHIKEGMNQGDLPAMIEYNIGILLIIRKLHDAHPQVTQNWYADDAGSRGHFIALCSHIENLMVRSYPKGYSPDPTKSILVVLAEIAHKNMLTSGIWGFGWSPEASK